MVLKKNRRNRFCVPVLGITPAHNNLDDKLIVSCLGNGNIFDGDLRSLSDNGFLHLFCSGVLYHFYLGL